MKRQRKFHKNMLWCSVNYKAPWRVVGSHKELGGGILSYHQDEAEAKHNAEVINATGGTARYEKNA